MKNYSDSDYALNKHSEGIVYRFADATTVTVTLADYLAENPDKAETDFLVLKKMSDKDYLKKDRDDNAQTKKNTVLDELSAAMRYAPSPEDLHIGKVDTREEAERRELRVEIMNRALDTLTEVQRRRYLLYRRDGLTMRQIADMESVVHSKIQKSVEAAEKKIKRFLTGS